jgi:hypothetical protein
VDHELKCRLNLRNREGEAYSLKINKLLFIFEEGKIYLIANIINGCIIGKFGNRLIEGE